MLFFVADMHAYYLQTAVGPLGSYLKNSDVYVT